MSKLEFDPGKAIGEGLLQMDKQELLRFVSQLCLHLKAEVGSRAYHGGIFPENICVSAEGEYAVGPAKLEKWSGQELEFVAPELYWHGEASPAADVYSLALLLYYGLGNGRLPFETATASGQLARMSGKLLPAPKAAGKRLAEVLEKATAFKVADRYQSPEELQIMLESCMDNKYLNGGSGAEAVFQKEDGQLSEIERMLVEIIESSGEEGEEPEEEPAPAEERSPEEIAGMEKPAPRAREAEDVSAMVEEFFGSLSGQTAEGEAPAVPEDAEDVRVYEPSHDKKDRQPIPILTEEKNPELAPVVLRQQPRYSRNPQQDPEQQVKAEQEVKKRRGRRPLAVVLCLCLILVAGALVVNYFWNRETRPAQINPTPDPQKYFEAEPETQPGEGETQDPTVVEPPVEMEPRYVVTASDMSWTEAWAACREQGAHLAVISTREEFETITALAAQQNLTYLWIGCQRVQGTLTWETEEPVNFSNWAEGEPSYYDAYDDVYEDYVMLFRVGDEWYYNDNRNDPAADYPAYYSGVMGYVCEFENR